MYILHTYYCTVNAIRSRIVSQLKKRYRNVDEAEEKMNIDIYSYAADVSGEPNSTESFSKTDINATRVTIIENIMQQIDDSDTLKIVKSTMKNKTLKCKMNMIMEMTDEEELIKIGDKIYEQLHNQINIAHSPKDFVTKTLEAATHLQHNSEPTDLVYGLAKGWAEKVLPICRMPYGILRYIIQFYTATHINQVETVQML